MALVAWKLQVLFNHCCCTEP